VNRREFFKLIGSATAWPLAAGAQKPPMPVVGILSGVSFQSYAQRLAALHEGLKEIGFVEGHNLAIIYRSADGQYERLSSLAVDLVHQQALVIIAIGTIAPARAAKAATSTIPIVFAFGTDPVRAGLVAALNRPEANVTGVSQNNNALAPKRLELIHELVPTARSIGFLMNPNNPASEDDAIELSAAARKLGCQLVVLRAGTEGDIDTAFKAIPQQGIPALVVHNDAFLNTRRDQIVGLAAFHALPAIYAARENVERGGLISYAPNFKVMFRWAGVYTGRILNGSKPADLPVMQPTTFELLINLKTAKALGLTVPLIMQMTADEVIE
jgi:putative ABC transport system substrate-binding protein